jgi:hypothetical protein
LNAEATRPTDAFESRRDIHAVADKIVVALLNIADVNAYSELKRLSSGRPRLRSGAPAGHPLGRSAKFRH